MTVERDQEEADGDVQALVRLVLHETRTPLNAICGFADLLLAGAGGPLSAESLDYVGQVADAARALERGLGHLQEIAAEGAATAPVPVDLAAGLREAGFAVAGGEVGPLASGDPAAWRRVGEVCRVHLQAGQVAPTELRATFRRSLAGRLEVTLAGPGLGVRHGPETGLLALELARQLARRVGGELRQPSGQAGIVIAWSVDGPPPGHRVAGQKAAAGSRGRLGA